MGLMQFLAFECGSDMDGNRSGRFNVFQIRFQQEFLKQIDGLGPAGPKVVSFIIQISGAFKEFWLLGRRLTGAAPPPHWILVMAQVGMVKCKSAAQIGVQQGLL